VITTNATERVKEAYARDYSPMLRTQGMIEGADKEYQNAFKWVGTQFAVQVAGLFYKRCWLKRIFDPEPFN